MGRFFQQAQPNFVDDNIYTPPWELATKVIGAIDQRNDNLLKSTDFLQGAVDELKHLNFDAENERVKSLQDKYEGEIGELTQAIYENPLEYRRVQPQIQKLQRKLKEDRTSGEIFQIEQRYNDYQDWLKKNEDQRESSPDLFNRINTKNYEDLVGRASTDPNARFRGSQIIEKPNLQSEEALKAFDRIKASYNEYLTKDGSYKIGDKILSEERVRQMVMARLLSSGNFAGYARQMSGLGDKGFFSEDGSMIPLEKEVPVMNPDGTPKTDEQGNPVTRRTLNPESAFYNDIYGASGLYGFTERSLDINPFEKQRRDQNFTVKQGHQDYLYDLSKQAAKDDAARAKMELQYELMGERDKELFKHRLNLQAKKPGGEDDAETLDLLEAKETIGTLNNPDYNYDTDLQDMQSNLDLSIDIPVPTGESGMHYISASPGTSEYGAQQRVINSTQAAREKLDNQTITLQNGKTFPAAEYLDYLDKRPHTEELAAEFLERKGYSFKPRQSLGEEAVDATRFMPGFMKSNFGKDWDKLDAVGGQFNRSRTAWYDKTNSQTRELSLSPIRNDESNQNIITEIRDNNPANFRVVDSEGNPLTARQKKNLLSTLDAAQDQVYVSAANAHSEVSFSVTRGDQRYYMMPNSDHPSAMNLATNLALGGLDKKEQAFKELRDRRASAITRELQDVGKNVKGTRSLATKIAGADVIIEAVGNEIRLYKPNSDIRTDQPHRIFANIHELITAAYN